MTNIVPNLLLLFLLFSCGATDTKPSEESENKNTLSAENFITDLPDNLRELSGLMIYDELFWGFNDSGGKNKLYGFNKEGEIKKEIEIEDAKNKDWESIAQDDKHIYIGDFGNNLGNRDNLRIYKIDKEDIKNDKEQKVNSKKIEFEYSNQDNFVFLDKTTPFDCEAMVEFEGSLYIFSKNWKNFTTTVYAIPTKKGEYTIAPFATFDVDGLITGADISPDKSQLALIGYKNYRSFICLFSEFPGNHFFEGKKQKFNLSDIAGAQTEGICFYGNDKLLVSCEHSGAFKQQVFLFNLNQNTNDSPQGKR